MTNQAKSILMNVFFLTGLAIKRLKRFLLYFSLVNSIRFHPTEPIACTGNL